MLLAKKKILQALKKKQKVMPLLSKEKQQKKKMKRSRVQQWDEAASWEIKGDVEQVPWVDFRHKGGGEARKP